MSNFTLFMNGTTNSTLSNVSSHTGQLTDKQQFIEYCCKNDGNQSPFQKVFCDTYLSVVYEDLDMFLVSLKLYKSAKITLAFLYGAIIALSLVGNSLVILTFAFNRHMRSTTNVFILSLAISDLLLTVTAVPFDVGETFNTFWDFGSFSCKLAPFMTSFSVSCSSLTLCCIAYDRFYAIVYPFKLRFFQTPQRACGLLFVVWLVSVVTSVPQAMLYRLVEFDAHCKTKLVCMQPLTDGIKSELIQIWLSFFVLFLIPLLIMGILYGIIIYRLWGPRPIRAATLGAEAARLRTKKRAIKMLVTVLILFVLLWLPLQCFSIVSQKTNLRISDTLIEWRHFLHCLAISSCCCNPIVYAFMNEKFRKNFASFLMCRRRARVSPELNKRAPGIPISHKLTNRRSNKGDNAAPHTQETEETQI